MRRGLSISDRAAVTQNPRESLRRLFSYLKPYKLQLVLVAILIIIFTGLNALGPLLTGLAIDNFILKKDVPGLSRIALVMIGVYALAWLAGAGYARLMAVIAQKAMRTLRQDLFDHMQNLSLSYYDRQSAGDLMSRLTNDMENISLLLSQNLVAFISSFTGLVAVLVMMLLLNIWLTLAALIVIPLMLVLTGILMKQIGPAFRQLQKNLGILNGQMEETLSGQRVIIAFDRHKGTISDFDQANQAARSAGIKANILAGLLAPLTMILSNLNVAIVVGVGALMAINGVAGVTVGMITAFTDYSRRFGHPLMQLANLFNSIVAALAGAERIFEVIDTRPKIVDKPEALELLDVKGSVVFEHVDFSYQAGEPVLKDVSLTAQPGSTIAMVGPTGAGKTTIINLLSRFYDIDDGRILIDGNEIQDVAQDSLRGQLGIVLQDTFLFADTVMENIRYGRLDASDEDVFAAAKLANADGFIQRLPEGYQTQLSERGSNLSQGQRQLLAIARAILADPSILILDEATSSVDTRTEMQIQSALLKLMGGRTSFVIAHRLSTIRQADLILVVDGGQIVERGTHNELLDAAGFYHNLYTSQFKGQVVVI